MTEDKMVSTRIDITLDTVVLKRLDELTKHLGMSRSAIIAMMINELYHKTNKVK